MISGNYRILLTPEVVLQRISEYDIFRYYMPNNNWKINQIAHSPFRNDDNPSFLIGNKMGSLHFIDFSHNDYRGDCFQFVKMLYNIPTLNEVLLKIDKDFGLGLSGKETSTNEYKKIIAEYTQPEDLGKRYSHIQVITRPYTKEEIAYYAQYHQDISDMRANNIYGIKKVYLNKKLFSLSDNDLRFGYYYDGHWKIYRPYVDKKFKWVPSNVPIWSMDGKENIKDSEYAFINKSKKDYMVVKKLLTSTCAVQNEGIGCFSPENVEFLKANSKRQILSFDSDAPGVENSQQITKIFDFDYMNVPRQYLAEGIKDWAELARVHGLQLLEKLFKEKGLI